MKPLFEVGEEVILCSKSHPELNGDAVVMEVINNYEEDVAYLSSLGFSWMDPSPGYPAYLLDVESPIMSDSGSVLSSHGGLWRQSALRKKYKPADKSFKELMSSANRLEVKA